MEFALVLPLLLLILIGMLDFGKIFNYWIDETHLANEGARYAVVEDPDGNPVGLMSPIDAARRTMGPTPPA